VRTTTLGYGAADGIRQKFTSRERDNETGLDYMHARYFAAAQGRFSSADTFGGSTGNPQSLNRYAYVTNNPLNFSDPTGHMPSIQSYSSTRDGDGKAYSWDDPTSPAAVLSSYTALPADYEARRSQLYARELAAAASDSGSATGDGNVPASAEVTGLAGPPQNAGRILIIVGDPGLGEYRAGTNLDRAAETKRQELEALGYVVIVVRASSDSDFAMALTNNGTLNGVEYIGHASYNALHVGEQTGAHTNLTHSDLSTLSNANLSSSAYIKLNACYAGAGGGDSIAAGISTQLQRTTLAFDGGTIYSGSERARVTVFTKSVKRFLPPGARYILLRTGEPLYEDLHHDP
jgi:RHS repeat-associated protein